MNVFMKLTLDFTRRVYIVQISINQYFQHHTGMKTTITTSFITREHFTHIETVYDIVQHTNRMSCRD